MTATPYQLLPPLTDEEYDALKESIRSQGVLIPVEMDEEGNILDGHHRVRIAQELGVEYEVNVRSGLDEREKRSLSRTLNTQRRHLSQAQKRMVIADELRENPSESNNAIAKRLGVSDSTVGLVRASLGDEVQSEWRVGADGKKYPATHQTTTVKPLSPGAATQFLDRFQNHEASTQTDFEVPTTRHTGPQYFQVHWALLEEDRDVVVAAVKQAKNDLGLRNTGEAIVAVCQRYLDGSED